MEQVLITGASGFVGKHLARHFLDKGHPVTGLGTSPGHEFEQAYENFTWVSADTSREGQWQDHAARADLLVNLAGRSIFKRWSKVYKQAIYDSRVLTTRHLVAALAGDRPVRLLSTSAVGFYGDKGDALLTEDEGPGRDFLARVCVDWEAEARKASDKGASVAVMRFGVVLGNDGALAVMAPAFKSFAGGPLGSGRQWFPWIHIKDLVSAVDFLAAADGPAGAFNFVGPEPVRQDAFSKALGRALHRPAIMPAPAFMVKLVMGELGASLLQSQRAAPEALENAGFTFGFPSVDAALSEIYGG